MLIGPVFKKQPYALWLTDVSELEKTLNCSLWNTEYTDMPVKRFKLTLVLSVECSPVTMITGIKLKIKTQYGEQIKANRHN